MTYPIRIDIFGKSEGGTRWKSIPAYNFFCNVTKNRTPGEPLFTSMLSDQVGLIYLTDKNGNYFMLNNESDEMKWSMFCLEWS